MSLAAQLWTNLDQLLQQGQIVDAIRLLEQELPKTKNPEEVSALTRRLSHLYEIPSSLQNEERSLRYLHLSAEAFMAQGRLGPAMAILKRLKASPSGQELAQRLHQRMSDVFSSIGFKKVSDEDRPPPTPYQELKAIVSFEQDEESWLRNQWQTEQKQKAPLFSWLRSTEAFELIQLANLRDLPAGTVLFREGDEASAFYFVGEGEVLLQSSTGFQKVFREGDCFGEIALFAEIRRTATMQSVGPVKVLEFSKEALERAFQTNPSLQAKVNHFYELRLFLHSASHHPLFQGISMSDLERLWDQMTSLHVPQGRVLFEKSGPRDRFFLVTRGHCSGFVGSTRVAQWTAGQFVGFSQALHRIEASSDCGLLECHQSVFMDLQAVLPQIAKAFDTEVPYDFFEDEATHKVILD
jgi:CRP-like cAMP-binding protein